MRRIMCGLLVIAGLFASSYADAQIYPNRYDRFNRFDRFDRYNDWPDRQDQRNRPETYSNANSKLKLHIGYNAAMPTGSLKDQFVSDNSYRGFVGELSYTLNPKVSLGLQSGFQNFYQKYDRAVYKMDETQSISAVKTNNIDIIPLLFKGTYAIGGDQSPAIVPYVSAGAGINLVNYSQYYGEFSNGEQSSVSFAAQAGAGISIPFKKDTPENAFRLGATYNYGSYNDFGLSNVNSIGINAGLVFKLK